MIVDPGEMGRIQEEADKTRQAVHQIVVNRHIAEKMEVLQALAAEWRVKPIDLEGVDVAPDVVKLLSDAMARQYLAVPFHQEDNVIKVAMADARKLFLLDDLRLKTGCEVIPYVSMPEDITEVLDRVYGTSLEAPRIVTEKELVTAAESRTRELMENLGDGSAVEEVEEKTDLVEVDASAPEVERIINALILSALQQKASDIHIQPVESLGGQKPRVVVRFRVDGFMKEAGFQIPWGYRNAVIAKLKIMTVTMNLTERRVPQSGRIEVLVRGNPIEFRVEVVPTVYGEAAALRLLDRRNLQVDITKLGLLPDTLEKLLEQIRGVGGKKNFGMILATGPTGSGKTTTLYSCLSYINHPDIRIVTAENPVEYNMDGIVQVQVNPEITLAKDRVFDFATALRSFLRFDPDVIMVGEIRDRDTAQIAVEAAMTGHLVFSTLHTNNAASTVARLTEMGPPPYLVVSTLKAVIAQRLCRTVCENCKEMIAPTPAEAEVFRLHGFALPEDAKMARGKGCSACGETGFRGRTGIYELLIMDPIVRQVALADMSLDSIRDAAMFRSPQQMRTMAQDGLIKVLKGWTTLPEVLGVAHAQES
jgi:type IV pilus assembly protein PilB